jgi:hypothetical protein
MSETKQELEITINVERVVHWTMQETVTIEGTEAECMAEAERIEELGAEEQIRLIAEHKDINGDSFLYYDTHWEYDEEEFIEESVSYDEPTEVA